MTLKYCQYVSERFKHVFNGDILRIEDAKICEDDIRYFYVPDCIAQVVKNGKKNTLHNSSLKPVKEELLKLIAFFATFKLI